MVIPFLSRLDRPTVLSLVAALVLISQGVPAAAKQDEEPVPAEASGLEASGLEASGVEARAALDPASKRAREESAYPVTRCPIPEGVILEVGGLEVIDGAAGPRVIATTRRGEAWAIDGFASAAPDAAPRFSLVNEGLHEPLGLLADGEGRLVTCCRGQLSRLVDGDGDGVYETVETITDWWQISGNYHEYNFGPTRAIDGSFWITTNKPFGSQPFGRVDWRGYALRITPDGEVTPMCSGLRSPAGVGTSPWGEVFYTDNQGEWCGAGKLSLLRPGSYHGHPWGRDSTEDSAWTFPVPKALPEGQLYSSIAASGEHPAFQMPAVWFPYDKMGRSPAGFVWDDTSGAFGPFAGQMFVADQYEAAVLRVDLERVGGHWQGACFRFRDGLASGALRLAFTPSGALLVGETDRGWGSKGPITEGIERIDWSGEVAFEIHTMRLSPSGAGFTLRFTSPADTDSLVDLEGYRLESYTYEATERYGSAELDRKTLTVRSAVPHADGLGVDLGVDGLREGYVHELECAGVLDQGGELGLLHPAGYYTLVRLRN